MMGLLNEIAPLEATQKLIDISVTERAQFKDCRRRWHLETIDNLAPIGPAPSALEFGTGVHAALEQYYLSGQQESAMWVGWDTWVQSVKERSEVERERWSELLDLIDLGEVMLNNYMKFDKQSKAQLGKVLAVEGVPIEGGYDELPQGPPDGYPSSATVTRHETGRMQCPIVDPNTKQPITNAEGLVPHLTGRLDILAERSTPRKGLWIVDHKTAAAAQNDRGLDFDDQVTGYCYIVWRWTGVVPRGAMFNTLIKAAPSEPRVLQNGTLSTAKDQNTLPDLYREALLDRGLMKADRISSEKHADCLNALLARGWDNFFRRFEPTRNEHELLAFERQLFAEYRDMAEAKEDASRVYKNATTRKCPYCPVNTLCQAMDDGSDAQSVLESRYTQKPDRKAERVSVSR